MISTTLRGNALATCLALACCVAGVHQPRAQGADDEARLGFDQMLDTRVRDGYVYYRALKANRAPLDRYVGSLAGAELPQSRDGQVAFWLNAYNAMVMRAVIDHYPIAPRTDAYPAHSIKQIAGVFERTAHVVVGKSVTLDQIEQSILTTFHDPRVFFALARGAAGGGRLRGEIYTAEALERQLAEQAAECSTRDWCVRVDQARNAVRVNAIFSWRRAEFVDAYAGRFDEAFAKRSPLEKAVVGFISPRIGAPARDFLAKNKFVVQYLPFDWSLNDLATRKR